MSNFQNDKLQVPFVQYRALKLLQICNIAQVLSRADDDKPAHGKI